VNLLRPKAEHDLPAGFRPRSELVAGEAYLDPIMAGNAEGAVGAVLNRAQLEALYGAPVETVADRVAGRVAFLPG